MGLFTLPVSGKKIVWKRVTIAEEMAIDGMFNKASNAHQRPYYIIWSRIETADLKPMTFADFGLLDPFDVSSLSEEINAQDIAYKLSFQKAAGGQIDVVANLEAAMTDLTATLQSFVVAAQDVIQMAKAAEMYQAGPLSPPSS